MLGGLGCQRCAHVRHPRAHGPYPVGVVGRAKQSGAIETSSGSCAPGRRRVAVAALAVWKIADGKGWPLRTRRLAVPSGTTTAPSPGFAPDTRTDVSEIGPVPLFATSHLAPTAANQSVSGPFARLPARGWAEPRLRPTAGAPSLD